MDLLDILKTINEDWKIMVFVFGCGVFYYQGLSWFRKITALLENTGRVHGQQNTTLDNIHNKLDALDKRMARIEGNVEILRIENNNQAIKIAVLETQTTEIIEHPVKRRVRRQQS